MDEEKEKSVREAIENMQQDQQIPETGLLARNEGDYTDPETGLLMCGKCHTAKQVRLEHKDRFGHVVNTFVVSCLCTCANEEYMRRQKELNADRISSRQEVAFGDSQMKNWTFGKDDQAESHISRQMRNYSERFATKFLPDGKGILLFGSVGTGKSFYAACVGNEVIRQGYSVRMTNFTKIANALNDKKTGKEEYLHKLNDCNLLIIDDMDIERDSDYMREIVYNVINDRYQSGKPIFVTTNLTSHQLKENPDQNKARVYSRLMEMCMAIEVTGRDRRYQEMRRTYQSNMGDLE